MLALQTVIQPYAWGRVDGMADHLGTEPTGGPEAELWVGTHPVAPSAVEDHDTTLDRLIADDPARHLGARLSAEGHTALPFLLKVLIIGRPLSLQAHPSADQARAGFAREEAAGIALDDPVRTYRDAAAKPEALVALEDTWALCGFRTPERALTLVRDLEIPALTPLIDHLREPDGLRSAFAWLLHLDGAEREAVLGGVARALPADPDAPLDPDDPAGITSTRAWIARIQHAFPGDPTAIAPLLVDIVRIPVGDAVHLPAGYLHAYLSGAGVEIMAASDNVLRGGLTPKHIDVDELLCILRFEPGHPPPPIEQRAAGGITYDCGEEAFELTAYDPAHEPTVRPTGPSLLLATDGWIRIRQGDHELVLDAGRAAFVAADEPPITIGGTGRLWWASTTRPEPARP